MSNKIGFFDENIRLSQIKRTVDITFQVLLAVGVTAVVVVALTIFAFQTKWDFTMMGGILFVALWLMIVVSLIMMFTRSETAHTIFAGFGALLFSAYLICKYEIETFCKNTEQNFSFVHLELVNKW